jgi:hypothetical protein
VDRLNADGISISASESTNPLPSPADFPPRAEAKSARERRTADRTRSGLCHGPTLHPRAPDSYSGQWLRALPGKSAPNRGSIDRNDRPEKRISVDLRPKAVKTPRNDKTCDVDFLFPQK